MFEQRASGVNPVESSHRRRLRSCYLVHFSWPGFVVNKHRSDLQNSVPSIQRYNI